MSTTAVIIANNAAQTANRLVTNTDCSSPEISLWIGVTGVISVTLIMVVIMLIILKVSK